MKIKVCGMRECENVQEIVQLSPDYLGFIFYKKSKRFVSKVPQVFIDNAIKKVGVFVNESIEDVVDTAKENGLDAIQLHGDESVNYCDELKSICSLEIIKAFSVDEYFNFEKTKKYESSCDLFIFDTKGKGYGGTGLKYDWSILKNYKGDTPFLLSGGIGVEDVEVILSFLRKQESKKCIGVDLNSGFEDAPGLKNKEKLKKFFNEVK